MSAIAAIVPFAAAFVVFASSTVLVIALLQRPLARALSGRRAASSSVRGAVVTAPSILAAIGCVALAFPNPFGACHCAEHGLHHPHLCLSHPGLAIQLIVPAAIVLGASLLLVAPRLLGQAREVIASARWAREVRRSPVECIDGIPFRIVDCASPSAFTVGSLSPLIVVDRFLWDALSEHERRAVLHHEHGHVERRDGLTLLLLRLCTALYPASLGKRLLYGWRVEAEAACDLHAATKLGDAGAVALALVAVARAQSACPDRGLAAAISGLGVGAGAELERRVLALLDMGELRRPEQLLGNDILASCVVGAGACALTLVWPGDTFHHAVESILGAFVF